MKFEDIQHLMISILLRLTNDTFPCIGFKKSFVVERMLCILHSQFLDTSILSLVTMVLHILKLVTVDAFK
jgi:hypothetical protein